MADNYIPLKSTQKKRYISNETFIGLDLSQIPVGSEYEIINLIEKGDLSSDINNALNKAENSLQLPVNQSTGSDGDALVKKGTGSEWRGGLAFKSDLDNYLAKTQISNGKEAGKIAIYYDQGQWPGTSDAGNGYLVSSDPVSPYHVVNKKYFDTHISTFSVEVW